MISLAQAMRAPGSGDGTRRSACPDHSTVHDLRGYKLNDQTRSLRINRNDCG